MISKFIRNLEKNHIFVRPPIKDVSKEIANTSNKNIRLNKSFTKMSERCFDTVAFDLKSCELETNLPQTSSQSHSVALSQEGQMHRYHRATLRFGGGTL